MKTIMKSILAGAIALALVTVGTSSAQARPWFLPPLPGRVAAGFVAGTVVGATILAPCYSYPAPLYPAAAYYPPGLRPVVVALPVPYFYGGFRVGYGWGPRYHYGYHGHRR
jgi:hypothetical protein